MPWYWQLWFGNVSVLWHVGNRVLWMLGVGCWKSGVGNVETLHIILALEIGGNTISLCHGHRNSLARLYWIFNFGNLAFGVWELKWVFCDVVRSYSIVDFVCLISMWLNIALWKLGYWPLNVDFAIVGFWNWLAKSYGYLVMNNFWYSGNLQCEIHLKLDPPLENYACLWSTCSESGPGPSFPARARNLRSKPSVISHIHWLGLVPAN